MAKQQAESQSRLRYDLPSLKKGEQVVSRWPELLNYPAFVEHGSGPNDHWAKFAIYYADAGSDYRNLSIDLKRHRCIKEADVPTDDPRIGAVLAGTDPGVLALLIEYVRLQDWLEYATIYHGREFVWRILAEIATPGNDLVDAAGGEAPRAKGGGTKDKTASMKYALETVQTLDLRWNALFMADPELKTGAQRQVQRDQLNSESRAEARKFIPEKPGKK